MAILKYFIAISLATVVFGNIDLYITQKEVQRILGMTTTSLSFYD